MADKWMDEPDRRPPGRDWRRSEDLRGDPRRFEGEGRSFDDEQGSFGARRSGPDRDRVFGERETGLGYGGEESRARYGVYRGGGQGGQGGGRPDWQDRDYQGVSPAMQKGEYDMERRAERYQQSRQAGRGGQMGGSGGRYYGDGGRERIYRQEYGQGGVEYGETPRGYEGEPGRMASGGTGGYDYERGYGDGGRARSGPGGGQGYGERDRSDRWEQRGREAGRDTGDFFRKAGERVASWFGGGEGERGDERRDRDFRGLGPKGYKRADERISDEAHERLTDDPWVDATMIAISVSGGEVTLSGTVENREAKHRAERCVEDISGVNHVQNNLRIDRGGPLTRATSGYGDSVLEHQMRGETGSGEAIPGARTAGGEGSKSGTNGQAGGSTSTDTGKSR
jgi:osmotically-inducible protein OsmY